jgi:hypothetical protein
MSDAKVSESVCALSLNSMRDLRVCWPVLGHSRIYLLIPRLRAWIFATMRDLRVCWPVFGHSRIYLLISRLRAHPAPGRISRTRYPVTCSFSTARESNSAIQFSHLINMGQRRKWSIRDQRVEPFNLSETHSRLATSSDVYYRMDKPQVCVNAMTFRMGLHKLKQGPPYAFQESECDDY